MLSPVRTSYYSFYLDDDKVKTWPCIALIAIFIAQMKDKEENLNTLVALVKPSC
jgi:hypothetical protein